MAKHFCSILSHSTPTVTLMWVLFSCAVQHLVTTLHNQHVMHFIQFPIMLQFHPPRASSKRSTCLCIYVPRAHPRMHHHATYLQTYPVHVRICNTRTSLHIPLHAPKYPHTYLMPELLVLHSSTAPLAADPSRPAGDSSEGG